MKSAEREFRSRERLLRELAAGQRDLVTIGQARALGFTTQSIGRRAASGAWTRVLPAVYLVGGRQPGFEQRSLAALLWAGDGAVLSHLAAATLWGLRSARPEPIELWIPPARRLRAPTVLAHRGLIAPNDRRRRDGLTLTSPARTLVDIAPRLDDETLESMTEDVLHRGLSTANSVRRCLERAGTKGRAGSGRLRALLDDRAGSAALESKLEVRIWRLLRNAGLRPVRQHRVRYDGASHRLDFAWPALRVAIEADGYDAHGGRIAFDRDRSRLAVLVAHGWRVVPVTWKKATEQPDAVIAEVTSALRAAAA